MMPYGPFLAALEASGYDIERVRTRFGISFEQAAQRLTTLGRAGARGDQDAEHHEAEGRGDDGDEDGPANGSSGHGEGERALTERGSVEPLLLAGVCFDHGSGAGPGGRNRERELLPVHGVAHAHVRASLRIGGHHQ
mgnify:CR=1 FL=1